MSCVPQLHNVQTNVQAALAVDPGFAGALQMPFRMSMHWVLQQLSKVKAVSSCDCEQLPSHALQKPSHVAGSPKTGLIYCVQKLPKQESTPICICLTMAIRTQTAVQQFQKLG